MSAIVTDTDCDVFVTYMTAEAYALAARPLHAAFDAAGLKVFDKSMVEPGSNVEKALWHAMAYSSAVVAVAADPREMSAWAGIEVGAALAWQKPIFVLLAGQFSGPPPSPIAHFSLFPLSRLDEVVQAVRKSLVPMTEVERERLCAAYRKVGTPTDRLIGEPDKVEELATQFNALNRSNVAGERLVRELINMRKRGKLPRLKRG